MSQSENGQRRMDQLPYYQEYVEKILRPRVLSIIDDVRQRLSDHAWQEILAQVAQDQGQSEPDPEALDRIRAMLEASLGLQLDVNVNVTFADGDESQPRRAQPIEPSQRRNVEVIDRQFPDNPLAQAVGSVRRASR